MISQLNCFTTNILSCDLNSWSTMNSIGTTKKLKSAGWIELYTRFYMIIYVQVERVHISLSKKE